MISDNENEEILLRDLYDGCPLSFKKLYDRYNQYIYLRILSLVKSEELALELLQDTFVKVWEKRSQFNIEKSFKGYLVRIAQNIVIDFFRKAAQDKKTEQLIIAIVTEYYLSGDSEIDQQHIHELNQAIELLPPQRRRVFTLCKVEGKSYQEVSDLLGVSVATINDHIVKGTRFIKKHCLVNDKLALFLLALLPFKG